MQFKEGHIGEYTSLAEEACAAGFHRAMMLTSYSRLKVVNHEYSNNR